MSKNVLGCFFLAGAISIAGCSDNNNSSDGTQQAPVNTAPVSFYIFATDGGGNVNVYSQHDDDTFSDVATIKPLNTQGGAVEVGEVHIAHGKAFISIRTGMTNAAQEATGGGLAVVDLADMDVEKLIAMPTTLLKGDNTPALSRFVHTYMDADHKYLWMNNDGPSGDAANDSVFRINIDPMDADATDGYVYLDYTEIEVGNGHKKSTFSYPDPVHGTTAANLFITHNLTAQSVSVIDNEPTSPTFLQVIETVQVGTAPSTNALHGMDFSPVSGHVYTGVVSGKDKAVNIIDAQASPITNENILVGMDMGMNQIPAAGYVHATHHHPYVMTTGYRKDVIGSETGYLSVINAATDTVVDVVALGNLSSSSFDISEMISMNMVRVFVPSRKDDKVEGEITTQIAVIDIDPMTGKKATGTEVRYIDVGEGTAHRNGEISPDAMYAYYPDGGDCGATHADHGPGCSAISVIGVHDETVIHKLHTAGHEPGSLTVVDVSKVDTGAAGTTAGHTH